MHEIDATEKKDWSAKARRGLAIRGVTDSRQLFKK
jgi:hypothetical protein